VEGKGWRVEGKAWQKVKGRRNQELGIREKAICSLMVTQSYSLNVLRSG
jgi:hypothetical protein